MQKRVFFLIFLVGILIVLSSLIVSCTSVYDKGGRNIVSNLAENSYWPETNILRQGDGVYFNRHGDTIYVSGSNPLFLAYSSGFVSATKLGMATLTRATNGRTTFIEDRIDGLSIPISMSWDGSCNVPSTIDFIGGTISNVCSGGNIIQQTIDYDDSSIPDYSSTYSDFESIFPGFINLQVPKKVSDDSGGEINDDYGPYFFNLYDDNGNIVDTINAMRIASSTRIIENTGFVPTYVNDNSFVQSGFCTKDINSGYLDSCVYDETSYDIDGNLYGDNEFENILYSNGFPVSAVSKDFYESYTITKNSDGSITINNLNSDLFPDEMDRFYKDPYDRLVKMDVTIKDKTNPPSLITKTYYFVSPELTDAGVENTVFTGSDAISAGATTYSQNVCGNYVMEAGEECDDGNRVGGDGCSSSCTFEKICEDAMYATTSANSNVETTKEISGSKNLIDNLIAKVKTDSTYDLFKTGNYPVGWSCPPANLQAGLICSKSVDISPMNSYSLQGNECSGTERKIRVFEVLNQPSIEMALANATMFMQNETKTFTCNEGCEMKIGLGISKYIQNTNGNKDVTFQYDLSCVKVTSSNWKLESNVYGIKSCNSNI